MLSIKLQESQHMGNVGIIGTHTRTRATLTSLGNALAIRSYHGTGKAALAVSATHCRVSMRCPLKYAAHARNRMQYGRAAEQLARHGKHPFSMAMS